MKELWRTTEESIHAFFANNQQNVPPMLEGLVRALSEVQARIEALEAENARLQHIVAGIRAREDDRLPAGFRHLDIREQRVLLPDDVVKAAFFRRPDISVLPSEEQDARWREHAVALEKFRDWLAGVPCLALSDPPEESAEQRAADYDQACSAGQGPSPVIA